MAKEDLYLHIKIEEQDRKKLKIYSIKTETDMKDIIKNWIRKYC